MSFKSIAKPIIIIVLLTIAALFFIQHQFGEKPSDSLRIQADTVLPDLTLTRLDGNSVRLSELNAKVLMLNFWATWCEACMEEMPSIVKLRNKYQSRGFEVLGINLDENPETAALRVVKTMGMEFPIFKDPEGRTAELFDVRAIPLTILINQQRKVLYVRDGEFNWDTPAVHTRIEKWLSE